MRKVALLLLLLLSVALFFSIGAAWEQGRWVDAWQNLEEMVAWQEARLSSLETELGKYYTPEPPHGEVLTVEQALSICEDGVAGHQWFADRGEEREFHLQWVYNYAKLRELILEQMNQGDWAEKESGKNARL